MIDRTSNINKNCNDIVPLGKIKSKNYKYRQEVDQD
jgi:hypothetical protein